VKAEESQWPWRPDHITNDGEEWKGTPLEELKGVGIISNEYLQGIQKAISADVENPTTLVEFSLKAEFVRNDSRLEVFELHPPCAIFRRYNYGEKCLECDMVHAFLFYGLNRENLLTEVDKRIAESKHIKEYTREDEKIHFAFVKNTGKPYLEYDCPILGYRELLFPIFFEDKVIATFFCGELCVDEKLTFIVEKQKDLSNKNSYFFNKYCASGFGGRIEDIIAEISDAHNTWIKNRSHVLSSDKYKALIQKCSKNLGGLEKTLDEEMRSQKERYIRRCIDVRINEFRKFLPDEEASSEDKRSHLWHNVEQGIETLLRDFAIKYAVVFGSKSLTRGIVSLLNVVAKAGDLPKGLLESIESGHLRFNMSKVPEQWRGQWVTTVEEPKIFNALEGWQQYNPATNLARVFPVPLFSHAALVVLVGYYDWNPLMSVENRPREQLSTALQIFYMLVLSDFSSVLASTEQERREKELGRLTHELKVPLVAIRGAAEFIIRTPGIKNIFDYDYPGDILSWIELMGRLIDNADRARYSDEKIEVKAKPIYLLREVIAPSIKQVRLLLDERGFCRHNITYEHSHFEQIPKLWLDRNQFQQVTFNLLSNAIKYAYDDPDAFSVEIDAAYSGKQFLILFRDWGPGIEAGMEEIVFEEGTRGENAFKMNVAGQGLGLWVVRQVVERHGGVIKVTNLQLPTEFTIFLPNSLTESPPA